MADQREQGRALVVCLLAATGGCVRKEGRKGERASGGARRVERNEETDTSFGSAVHGARARRPCLERAGAAAPRMPPASLPRPHPLRLAHAQPSRRLGFPPPPPTTPTPPPCSASTAFLHSSLTHGMSGARRASHNRPRAPAGYPRLREVAAAAAAAAAAASQVSFCPRRSAGRRDAAMDAMPCAPPPPCTPPPSLPFSPPPWPSRPHAHPFIINKVARVQAG